MLYPLDKKKQQTTFVVNDETETINLAGQVANQIQFSKNKSFNLYLSGNLGAGKTTFVRYLLRHFGYDGKVKSPTYSLIESYKINHQGSEKSIFHLDLYRLNSSDDLEFLDIKSCFESQCLVLIEWPDYFLNFLPDADIFMTFEYQLAQKTDYSDEQLFHQKRVVHLFS